MIEKDPNILRDWFNVRDTQYNNITEAIWLYIADTVLAAFSDVVGVSVNDIEWKNINLLGEIIVISCSVPQTRDQFETMIKSGHFTAPSKPIVDDFEFVEYNIGIPLSIIGQSFEQIKMFFRSPSEDQVDHTEQSPTQRFDFDYSALSDDQTNRMIITTLSIPPTKQ